MTVPKSPWDRATGVDPQAAERLGQIVSGNDQLVSEPGLVQALFQSNATPQQAQAINSFVAGLTAEKKVNAATASNSKVRLSDTETGALDAMGIDYSKVQFTYQDAVSNLKTRMAAQGLEPVMKNGQVQTDKSGNILASKITQPAKPSSGGGGGFLSSLGHAIAAPFKAAGHLIGGEATALYHGKLYPGAYRESDTTGQDNPVTLQHTVHALNEGYQYGSAQISMSEDPTNIGKPFWEQQVSGADQDLARQLGYDPSSWFSMQAFKARGYAHHDTSNLSDQWDQRFPDGKFGMNGSDAVTQAEVFASDPAKYVQRISQDKSLSADQAAQRIEAISSKPFMDLVRSVNGQKADIGTDTARDLGIDPVKHPTLFAATTAGANLAASIVMDPTAVGLTAFSAVQRSSVAVRNMTDAAGIAKAFDVSQGLMTPAKMRSVQNLRDMVDHTNQLREAINAGDRTQQAAIMGRIQANPFGGLVGDFLGEDQIVGLRSSAELNSIQKGELAFRTGRAEPIQTYDEAVNYLASKGALARLQNGYAPVESTVIPGALSNRGYQLLKGRLSSWSAAHAVSSTDRGVARFAADPGRVQALLDNGTLLKTLPGADDAIDVLTGRVIAAQQAANTAKTASETESAASELASAKRGLANALQQSDVVRGVVRGNRLRYGQAVEPSTRLGKVASIYTLGAAKRAQLVLTRLTNFLPRTTWVRLDSSADADTIRKVGRTYLTSGDANQLAVRWALGDGESRKTVVQGLQDQIMHASGMTRTKAGRELADKWKTDYQNQRYLITDRGFKDTNGVLVGMYPGQMEDKFRLPNFGMVHRAAAKVGLYEATMGRMLTGTGRIPSAIEKLMVQWKLGALMTPVTAIRANTEAWLNAGVDNGFSFMDALKAKALLRERGILDRTVSGERNKLTARSAPMDKILSFAPLRGAGHIYRNVLLRNMSPEEGRAIIDMMPALRDSYIADQAAFHQVSQLSPELDDLTAAAEAGLKGRPTFYRHGDLLEHTPGGPHRQGWEITDEVDAARGARMYAHNLGFRVNKSPEVARAIIRLLKRTDNGPESEATALDVNRTMPTPPLKSAGQLLDDVVAELEKDPHMRHSLFGKVYLEQGVQRRAVTPQEVALGKQQWAAMISEDFRDLTTGRNGVLQHGLLDEIDRTGLAPSDEWIVQNIKGLNRPQRLLAPIINVEPEQDGIIGLAQQLLDKEGKGYQWMVERQIQRHSTSPLFHAAYAKEKVALEPFKQGLIDEAGIHSDAAELATQTMAAQRAWERISRMVDDPHMRSQIDVTGRAFFAFSRATTMMLRRWGSTLWRNPEQARRMQLAAEASVQSGFVYKDPSTGDWMFNFPGTGAAQEVLMHAMNHIPGFRGAFLFPTADFTGRVASIIPGSDNPFQYSTNPIVSISGRSIASLMPEHRALFDEVDRRLNGSQGQGQGFWATLEPNVYKKVVDSDIAPWLPGSSDGRNAAISSAMVGSLYNLYAAGQVPPDKASATQVDTFMGRLKTGTKNQLFLRAILGVFSPASVSMPSAAGQKADFAYAVRGAQGLRDEYKMLLDDTNGDYTRATAIWTALHPDETVYTESSSSATTSRAILPATNAALNWMNDNHGFISKYKRVSAYFIPEGAKNAPYSQEAYRAQLEEGLRQRKTPSEFLADVYNATAAAQYYPMYDQYQADLASAKAANDPGKAAQLRDDWSVWSKDFKAKHQTFAGKITQSADSIVQAQQQMADLRAMLKNKDVPGGQAAALRSMVESFDNYQQYINDHPGTTNAIIAQHQSAFQMLQQHLLGVLKVAPGLTDLYNGVFRPLSSFNLSNVQQA